jgi:hypothetical protein
LIFQNPLWTVYKNLNISVELTNISRLKSLRIVFSFISLLRGSFPDVECSKFAI